MLKKVSVLFFVFLLFLVPFKTIAAPPPGYVSENIINSGLNNPTSFEIAADGRIFIAELEGKVKIYKDGALLSTNFTELPALAKNDRGLLSTVLDPDFSNNKYIYFYYIDKNDSFHKVVRLTADGDTGQNLTTIFSSNLQAAELHAGGGLDFGPDGKLYVSIGDSGPSTNAQDLSVPMGKVLRMNKDGSVPDDNPFVNGSNQNKYIWAYGFRNPFRMQFDNQGGTLYLGDVGYQAWEEINIVEKGSNYGWPLAEGNCGNCPYKNPFYSYATSGGASVIIGPTKDDNLYFGDYVKGFIKSVNKSSPAPVDFEPNAGAVIDIKEADGSIYYLTIYPGSLHKITQSGSNNAPTSAISADKTSGGVPLEVSFKSNSTDPDNDPLTYYWDFGDQTTSTQKDPIKTYSQAGKYSVVLATSDGTHTTKSIPFEIQVGLAPTLTIISPTQNQKYEAGEEISFSAESDGTISREIIFHHNTHTHPFLHEENISQGSFTIPRTGEPDANQWYEVIFKSTSGDGLTTSRSVKIMPSTVQTTFSTNPENLDIILDGTPIHTPLTKTSVVGYRHILNVDGQTLNGNYYEFQSWSDGGSKQHTIDVPETNTTFTANFILKDLNSESGYYSGEYFNNINLQGNPALVRQDEKIDFDWGRNNTPDPEINFDQYSVKWIKTQEFNTGIYQFEVHADDGVRLFLDDQPIIDKWFDQPNTYYFVDKYIPQGKHTIRMEYYEAFGGAVAKLDIKRLPDTFSAEYFDNPNLLGTPAVKKQDKDINLVLGEDSPHLKIPADQYSVRWTKKQYFNKGSHGFTIRADDGVRFWIDDNLITDDWNDHSMKTYTPIIDLTEGVHEIRIEYYENFGNSVITFNQDL